VEKHFFWFWLSRDAELWSRNYSSIQQLNTHMQSAVHLRRPQHLSIQWKTEAPRPPATWPPGPTVDRERGSGEGNDIFASILMRIRVDYSEDVWSAGADSPEHHHHPQELRNPIA